MKDYRILFVAALSLIIFACHKPAKIQITNRITAVKIEEVTWGKFTIASSLLPGETSEKLVIDRSDEKLPNSQRIYFKMSANNKTIYLATDETFLLNEEDDLLIELKDDTKVSSPNQ